ncbi:hypothetical protein HDE80_002793 [Rhodanobacter sp. A1T4]|nr:hypothetical protein [Rhodanobacter sp. A1T4]
MGLIRVPRDELESCDLSIDAVYEGSRSGNAGDDPLGALLGVSNQGGFRHLGKRETPRLLVITTSMSEPDWPDHLDPETGVFTYYGDNRHPGLDLHSTRRWGNVMLRDLFARAHSEPSQRKKVPPVFVFQNTGTYRYTRFLGLAVPGGSGLSVTQDLVATWHHARGERFQNYRATFTVLNATRIARSWISSLRDGTNETRDAPKEWISWVNGGQPTALRALPTTVIRTKQEQLPDQPEDVQMLRRIYQRFETCPTDFEKCACRIVEMLLPNVVSIDPTRPSRDGGRDGIGKYRIGSGITAIDVDFALEAKCYDIDNSVGVKATSRLISRLRHRQFGVLVTTSYLHVQAYKEIREDRHPILVVSGADIVNILKRCGIRDCLALSSWLTANFS